MAERRPGSNPNRRSARRTQLVIERRSFSVDDGLLLTLLPSTAQFHRSRKRRANSPVTLASAPNTRSSRGVQPGSGPSLGRRATSHRVYLWAFTRPLLSSPRALVPQSSSKSSSAAAAAPESGLNATGQYRTLAARLYLEPQSSSTACAWERDGPMPQCGSAERRTPAT